MTLKVAALFVETSGVYSGMSHVDLWDKKRDAKLYKGPLPVVAHPPCQLWGALAAVNYARWGGEHNRPGNDDGCFSFALESVRKYGGVLEHPSKSKAFSFYGLKKPESEGWQETPCGGYVCNVWQSAYGHKANKATWLYYFGKVRPFDLRWDKPKGKFQIGYQDKRGKEKNKPTLSKKEANATPLAFRDELIMLALRSAK
jgi:hypothetical protein